TSGRSPSKLVLPISGHWGEPCARITFVATGFIRSDRLEFFWGCENTPPQLGAMSSAKGQTAPRSSTAAELRTRRPEQRAVQQQASSIFQGGEQRCRSRNL